MMGMQSTVTAEERRLSIRRRASWRIQARLRSSRLLHGHARRRASPGELHRERSTSRWASPPLQENVTVTGASPVVDTQSTSISTTFDKETLANLPSARDYWAILSEAPGVKMQRIDVGGSAAGTQTTYFVYGTTGQVRPMVEGINSTEGTGAFGNYVDYGSFEEVSIGSGASSAESPVPGVFTQFIQQIGRQHVPRLVLRRQGVGRTSSPTTSTRRRLRPASPAAVASRRATPTASPATATRTRTSAATSKKDKAWWYASVRGLDSIGPLHQLPCRGAQDRAAELHRQGHLSAVAEQQADWLLPAQFEGAADAPGSPAAERDDGDPHGDRRQLPPGLRAAAVEGRVELDPHAGDLLRSADAGSFGYDWEDTPSGSAPSYEDLNTNMVSGRARARDYVIKRNQVLGSLSYLKNGWIGTHNFKVGGECFRETQTAYRFAGSYNDVLQVLRSGVPSEVMLFEPAASENGLDVFGTYLQDNWKLGNRLTLNLGLRFDYYRNFLPEQTHDAFSYTTSPIVFPAVDNLNSWSLPAPRVGVTYSLTEDGKTVLKGNYGKYWWNPGAQLAQDNNPNPETWFRRYVWNDLNGDTRYQAGEEGRLTSSAGGVATQVIDPNLKDSYTNEIAGWLEREVIRDFGVRTGVVYRTERNLAVAYNQNRPFSAYTVPVTIQDPGPDGVVGNKDDGSAYTGYNLNAAALALPIVNTYSNVDGAQSDYYTFELTGTKRMSHNWSAMMSFSKTWSAAQAATFFGTGFRQNALPVSPQDLINTEPDGQVKYTDWSVKLNGTYQAPWGFKISPMLRLQAGQNWGRTFSATLNYGTVRIAAEPLDTNRQRDIAVTDIRIEKQMSFGGSLKVGPFLDVYNMFNTNAEQNITWASGASFLRPTAIVPPRVARIGAKVSW